jgi:hypothetical protein
MIVMVMRGEDVGQCPSRIIKLARDLGRIRRVDGNRFTALVVMQQKAVIVRATDELAKNEACHAIF